MAQTHQLLNFESWLKPPKNRTLSHGSNPHLKCRFSHEKVPPYMIYMKKLQCLETITKRYNSHFHSENSISFHIPQSGRNFIVQSKLQFCDKISFQMLKHLQIDVLIFSQMIRFTSEKTDINDRYDISWLHKNHS